MGHLSQHFPIICRIEQKRLNPFLDMLIIYQAVCFDPSASTLMLNVTVGDILHDSFNFFTLFYTFIVGVHIDHRANGTVRLIKLYSYQSDTIIFQFFLNLTLNISILRRKEVMNLSGNTLREYLNRVHPAFLLS